MRALIVDQSRDRSSVAAARALSADGWTVGSGAWRPTIAALSRHVSRYHRIEEVERDEDRFIADIARAVKDGGYEVVLCGYDVGLLVLSRRREEIGGALVPYAAHSVVERSFDKLAFTRAAESVGLAVPRTVEANDESLANWRGPVVVKAKIHAPTRYDTKPFASALDAKEFVSELREQGAEPLLQERIGGRLGAVVVVADRESRVVAEVQQVCERSWPAAAGITARACTTPIEPEISARIADLVAGIGWFGLAEIEFLLDDDGVPRFTDFNGRVYGGVALAQAAGVNVVATWARLATNRPVASSTTSAPGTYFQWLNRDLAASYAEEGWRGAARALAIAPRAAHSVGSMRDPGPSVRFLVPELLRRTASRLRR